MHLKHSNFPFASLFLIFITPLIMGMEEELFDVASPSTAITEEPIKKRKWEDVSQEERYFLWLKSQARQTDPKSMKLNNEALALLSLVPLMRDQLPQIADYLYEEIDPMFIQQLLCFNKKPKTLFSHSNKPYLHWENDKTVHIKCNHKPHCQGVRSYDGTIVEDVYTSEQRIYASIYHSWNWIQKSCRAHKIAKPLHVVVTNSGDFITSHEDFTVRFWGVGTESQKAKDLFSGELTFEEILMLKHMQRTKIPLDQEAKQLKAPFNDQAKKREETAKGLPRKLRAIRREKLQKK